ncbi:MAG: glycoside hydrolase family 127 protein [Clostridia bacterium]|nr:glycoside hydrolase family 127 protein [Clostridia bacterium]
MSSRPVRFEPVQRVKICGGMWKSRVDAVRKVTARACAAKCEETGRVDNFRKASGRMKGAFRGIFFDDADVYKTIEGIAYVLMDEPDEELRDLADRMVGEVCAAQREDGYLYTYFTLGDLGQRWTDMDHHEAFCVGQIVEAGIAWREATGDSRLYEAALRAVEQMMSTVLSFKDGWINGHEGVEMALAHLYRYTGEIKYLDYARWFIEQRGHVKLRLPLSHDKTFFTDEYCQNNAPVRELTHVTGHAVRAMYYYSGVADVASVTGERALVQALERVWDNLISANTYITGGIGQSSFNEGFSRDFSQPNLHAYCETCASVGMAFWNHRMNLIEGQSKYADVVETEIMNGILSGLSLRGDRYFYENPLASTGAAHRREWFTVPCCPTNLVRFVPAIGRYVYAKAPGALAVNQFIDSRVETEEGVVLRQRTDYPWHSRVELTVEACREPLTLRVRKPGWCESWSLSLNGEALRPDVQDGYLSVDVRVGDVVVFIPDMPVRRVYADPRVLEDAGRVAVMRGPVVYCAEETDNPGIPTEYFHAEAALPREASLSETFRPDLLGGVTVVRAGGLTMIPYCVWDNRASGGMAVWLKET